MEPMTLGSPVGSPVSSPQLNLFPVSSVLSSSATTSFYPAYLIGESQSGCVPPGSISPGRPSRQFSSVGAVSSPSSPQVLRDAYFPTARLGGDRPGGPPTLSLMGGLPQSPSSRIPNTTFVDHQKIISSPHQDQSYLQSPIYSSPVPSHQGIHPVTPFTPTSEVPLTSSSLIHVEVKENQMKEPLVDTWVTVYGFPVAAASYILTQFAQLGSIVDQRLPGSGNWMHLKYQTKLQARKALAKNSKIFNGNIMVGVVPCTDATVVGEKENLSLNSSFIMSPRDPAVPTTPKSHIRPLTQAYQASRAEIEVTPTSGTPKKRDSLVAKAVQHILGI